MCFDRNVTAVVRDIDRYRRTIADVILSNGRILNVELVSAGLAWHYKAYSTDTTLARAEQKAREKKAGLWTDPYPIPPWDWRRGKRE